MKFKLYREHGALNSSPVFDALSRALKRLGHQEVSNNEDCSVIWSVLWHGRMSNNRQIYEKNKKEGKQTLILEVGNFKRNITWRLSLGHINNFGIFGNDIDLNVHRLEKLGIKLEEEKTSRSDTILIACQHDKSLQWEGMPPVHQWANQTISKIKQYTNRPIIVRPHPRCTLKGTIQDAGLDLPVKVANTYDDYNIDYNYHCVINYNSGPCIQAAIRGVPIICHSSSLAYDVSDIIENIEHVKLKPRDKWLLKLAHTEWTVEEIASGDPLIRILSTIR